MSVNNYKTGYIEALRWVAALSKLLTGTANAELENCADPTRRASLEGAIQLGEEFNRQIDDHAKDLLCDVDVDTPLPPDEGMVH